MADARTETKHEWCTYITFYKGKKLPPFYIGFSRLSKVLLKGYRGSPKSKLYYKEWCDELTNNPHLFKTKIIKSHTTKLAALEHEKKIHLHFTVHINPMYTNMSIAYTKWINCDDKTRKRISAAKKGKKLPPRTKEHRAKLGQSSKGRIPWNKGKTLGPSGRTPWNKGIKVTNPDTIEKLRKASTGRTLSESTKAKLSVATKKVWEAQGRSAFNIKESKQ